jgi:hypothetical protein
MRRVLLIGLMLLALCVLISLPFPVGGAGALSSPWPTPWELTPPYRPTPTGGPPPPIDGEPPQAHPSPVFVRAGVMLYLPICLAP